MTTALKFVTQSRINQKTPRSISSEDGIFIRQEANTFALMTDMLENLVQVLSDEHKLPTDRLSEAQAILGLTEPV